MNLETAIERVKLYLKWCSRLIDDLDSGNAPVDGPVGWRRNGETWLPASTWHQIFEGNEADEAAAELDRNACCALQTAQDCKSSSRFEIKLIVFMQ
jgi:hypothetical protein